MTKKIRVDYELSKCIGNAACAKHSPRYFKIVDSKARLLGSKLENGRYSLDTECDESTAGKLIKSAENCPVNAIGIIDLDTNTEIVTRTLKITQDHREIIAEYDDLKEFVMDPKGYFLIKIDKEKKEIQVGFCGMRNKVEVTVRGKKPIEIYQTIIKQGLVTRLDHAAYLGRELQKAYIALLNGIEYVQDDELILTDRNAYK